VPALAAARLSALKFGNRRMEEPQNEPRLRISPYAAGQILAVE
jgi:hypothetical protein